MTTQHDVIDLYRKVPGLTSVQMAEHLRCSPEYVRAACKRNGLVLPGAKVPVAKFDALLASMEAIRDGLADTGSKPGAWMTKITKADAVGIADVAIKAARAAR